MDREKGSPPPARGASFPVSKERIPTGITPACAGSMLELARQLKEAGDHPRLRGEH